MARQTNFISKKIQIKDKEMTVTVQCYIFHGGKVLIQNRPGPVWRGLAVPGGHVESKETIREACVRETKEETGLDVDANKLSLFGEHQYHSDQEGDCLALLYKTSSFDGDLRSSEEGEMSWMKVEDVLASEDCAEGFKDLLKAASKNKIVSDSKISDIIKKQPEGYIIYSEKGKRLSKPFKTRAQAEERLKQIEMFKHMKKDSAYKGYDIEYKGDLWQIWKDGPDGDRKIAGDFVSLEEAREWIDSQEVPQLHRYDVVYIDYATDTTMVEYGVMATSADAARKKVKKMYGNQIYGYPKEAYLVDSEKEISQTMLEEVKNWLSKYLVKKEDPDNKLGKTHIRPLGKEERLPSGVRHKAKTDTSGILHYKGKDYYWYLQGDEIVVEEYHTHDSLGKRFICETRDRENHHVVLSRIETNDLNKIQEWAKAEQEKGDILCIDKLTGEVWALPEIPEKVEDAQPLRLWIVEWRNKNGVKFTGEFDSEEDAKDFVDKNEDDVDFYNMKITQKDTVIEDAAAPFDAEAKKKKVLEILSKYLKGEGYEDDDIQDWVNVRFSNFENDEGDKGVKCEIATDLDIEYYDLPDEVISALEKEIGFLEPYSPHIWESVIWDKHIEDSAISEGKHTVEWIAYTQYDIGLGEVEIDEDERYIEEYDTYEEAKEEAASDKYGVPGQYVEVKIDGHLERDYEA